MLAWDPTAVTGRQVVHLIERVRSVGEVDRPHADVLRTGQVGTFDVAGEEEGVVVVVGADEVDITDAVAGLDRSQHLTGDVEVRESAARVDRRGRWCRRLLGGATQER